MLASGKGLSNGYPLSMMALKHEIGASKKIEGKLGSTYSGNVLSCVAACTSLVRRTVVESSVLTAAVCVANKQARCLT